MSALLAFDSPMRDPVTRHEVGEPVADPIGFIVHDDVTTVVGSVHEEGIFARREDVVDQFLSHADLGRLELEQKGSLSDDLLDAEILRRALAKLDVSSVVVPPTFRLLVADYLRDKGIDVSVDADVWARRRRRKNAWELEAIERAQRAAETAMLAAARMLREAEPTGDGHLRFEGEVLTAEIVREAMSAELLTQGAESEGILVQSGAGPMKGHDLGSGPIRRNETVIIDCFPRERRQGAYSDMTRTFVPGRPSPEVQKLHAHCREALDVALDAIRPGRSDVFTKVAEFFNAKGYPTKLHHRGPDRMTSGFTHSLGHGVGLEIHEPPSLGINSEELVEGDVVAVEPGLYFEGVGNIRLEDTVVVSGDGAERFTDPYPYDLEP